MTRAPIVLACLVCSLAVHAALLTRQSKAAPLRVRHAPPSVVHLSVAPMARPVPEPEPDPAPKLSPPPAPSIQPQPAPKSLAPKAPTASASPQSPSEPTAQTATNAPPMEAETSDASLPELTGTTLVSDLGYDWSAPAGNGDVRRGAIRAGLPQATVGRRSATGQTPAPGVRRAAPSTATTPLSELSQKPVPPPLATALERNYPPEARRHGKAGEAKVRARIDASGFVGVANVAFESGDGFGKACQRTLLASAWTPPLDRAGRPVSTWVTYRCKFRIDD